MKRLLRDGRFRVCGAFILAIILTAVFAEVLAPHPHEAMSGTNRLVPPGPEFLLGTDEFGRDLLSRMIFGARLTLIVSLGSVSAAAVVGTTLGLMAGYGNRTTEIAIMRVIDSILSFPAILLAIFVVVFIGPELRNVILTIAIIYTPRFARVVHGVTLAAKRQEYVESARALGATDWRIMFRAILPNIAAPVMVQVSLALGDAMLLESSLSFLGLGPPPPAAAWGRIISSSARFMHMSAHPVLWTSVALSLTVLAFNLMGDAVRDALDPRLKR